jgi:hypothetical protein
MNNRKEHRYTDNLENRIHVMSFARELRLKDISLGGLSFYSPKYEKDDIILITITIPTILQIFQEKILIVSLENELVCRARFISPSEDFITTFKEFMEENDE